MANVLGELFSEIANAIREKTGDTATMKPAEFPAKIGGITVGVEKEEEAVTAALNLANGNQTVLPTEGKVLSSVTIEKPTTLLPENIAEGVDIAGIIGTLAAGGGGGGIKFFYWSEKPKSNGVSSDLVITHNMGVTPDIALVVASANYLANECVFVGIGFSTAFNALAKASGNVPYGLENLVYRKAASTGKALSDSIRYFLDEEATSSWGRVFYNGNAETITLGRGSAGNGFDTNTYLTLYLFGGLT